MNIRNSIIATLSVLFIVTVTIIFRSQALEERSGSRGEPQHADANKVIAFDNDDAVYLRIVDEVTGAPLDDLRYAFRHDRETSGYQHPGEDMRGYEVANVARSPIRISRRIFGNLQDPVRVYVTSPGHAWSAVLLFPPEGAPEERTIELSRAGTLEVRICDAENLEGHERILAWKGRPDCHLFPTVDMKTEGRKTIVIDKLQIGKYEVSFGVSEEGDNLLHWFGTTYCEVKPGEKAIVELTAE